MEYLYKLNLNNMKTDIYIDLDGPRIYLNNKWHDFELTKVVRELLTVFAINCGIRLTFDQILNNHPQWSNPSKGSTKANVTDNVSKLNKCFQECVIEACGGETNAFAVLGIDAWRKLKIFESIHGDGYRFNAKKIMKDAEFGDAESDDKATDSGTINLSTNNVYESIFIAMDCVLSTSLNVGDKQKQVPLTRATVISLAKYCANVDLDNELSVDSSAEELNDRAKESNHLFLREFVDRGYRFIALDKRIVVVKDGVPSPTTDRDELFEVLMVLYNAYKKYEIHKKVYSDKKIELNITVSTFLNAISSCGVFFTTERKTALGEIIKTFVETHNHDANFLYPILANPKTQRPPRVEFEIADVVGLVGAYCKDVYKTDNNAVVFMNHFIQTLEHFRVSAEEKVKIFEYLIYKKNLYHLRVWRALAEVDNGRITLLQTYVGDKIFPLAKQKQALENDDIRKLVLFCCMFARGTFDSIIYFNDDNYKKGVAGVLNFVLRKFGEISKYNGGIRRMDIAQGVAKALLTIYKNDSDMAKGILGGINFDQSCFDGCILLKDAQNFIIKGVLSTYLSKEYRGHFTSDDELFAYIKDKGILEISQNPFLNEQSEDMTTSLVIFSFINIRAALKRGQVPTDFFDFSNKVSTWLIEVSKQQLKNGELVKYLRLICEYYRKFNPGLQQQAKELLRTLISEERFNQVEIWWLKYIWQIFLYELEQGRFDSELASQLQGGLNGCFKYYLDNNGFDVDARFALMYYPYVNEETKKSIVDIAKHFVDADKHLSLSGDLTRRLKNLLKNSDEHLNKLLLSIPKYSRQTNYEKYRSLEEFLTDNLIEKIVDSIVKGEEFYVDFIGYFIKSDIRSWERAYLQPILSKLLVVDNFVCLKPEFQNLLVHYAKKKGEYHNDISRLMEDIAAEGGCFPELETRVKTAFVLNLYAFDNVKECYSDYLKEMLNELTNNAYSHAEIKRKYGVRVLTLIYHILKNYQGDPRATALLCVSEICKLYKQVNRYFSVGEVDLYGMKLLSERIRIFDVVVSNPCIRNISKHYVDKMLKLMNKNYNKFNWQLARFYTKLDSIYSGNWPEWFGIEHNNINVVKEDNIADVGIKSGDFCLDSSKEPDYQDKAIAELFNWRGKDDREDVLEPKVENEVVVYKTGDKYAPVSGWTMVYAYVTDTYLKPKHITATVIEVAEVDPLVFDNAEKEMLDSKKITDLFADLVDNFRNILQPRNAIKQANGDRFYLAKSARYIMSFNDYQKVRAFIDFYHDYVLNDKINELALEAYYDYYCAVKKTYDNVKEILQERDSAPDESETTETF